ncbi:MAG: hypothetical protein U0269_32910 [Polyangiales bacterium]
MTSNNFTRYALAATALLAFACGTPQPTNDASSDAGDASSMRDAAALDVMPSAECAALPAISASTTLTAQNFTGAPQRNYGAASGCTITSNPTRLYSVILQPGKQITAAITRGTRLAIQLIEDDCASTSCIANAEAPNAMRFTNASSAPRLVYLAVVSTEFSPAPDATFDLEVTINDAPAGLLCARPIDVMSGARLTGQTFEDGVDFAQDVCTFSRSNAAFYRVNVPAGQRLTVAARATGFAPQLRVVDGCANTMCLASATTRSETPRTANVTYTNSTAAARSVIITVNGFYNNVFGTFDLDVDTAP